MDTAIEFTLKNGPGHILYVPYWISFPINSWWTPGKLLMESWWSPHTHHEVNLDFIRSPSGVYQESIRSIRTLLGLLMESIRSPSGVHQESIRSLSGVSGLYQDSWWTPSGFVAQCNLQECYCTQLTNSWWASANKFLLIYVPVQSQLPYNLFSDGFLQQLRDAQGSMSQHGLHSWSDSGRRLDFFNLTCCLINNKPGRYHNTILPFTSTMVRGLL